MTFLKRTLLASSVFSLPAMLLAAHPAAAQTTIIGFTPSAYGVTDNALDTGASSYSLGYSFTANQVSFVTSLGYFNDPSFDPSTPFNTVALSPEPTGSYTYASSHQVGLYQIIPAASAIPETGVLLGETTITSASTASGDFLYNTLTAPIALVPGAQYEIAGVTGSKDPYLFNIEDDNQPNAVGLTVNSAITYGQDRATSSDTLAFATGTSPNAEPGFFGPNFQISSSPTASAAPEPSQWSALGFVAAGLGTLVLRARRRRANAAL